LLDADPPLIDRLRQILADIRAEDERASDVIRQVRALSRKQLLESKPLSLNTLVAEVLLLVEADARRRGVEIQADYGTGLPEVSGDPPC
jgi:two-component system sensor kinase FixL